LLRGATPRVLRWGVERQGAALHSCCIRVTGVQARHAGNGGRWCGGAAAATGNTWQHCAAKSAQESEAKELSLRKMHLMNTHEALPTPLHDTIKHAFQAFLAAASRCATLLQFTALHTAFM
jgi:hypothetical protein